MITIPPTAATTFEESSVYTLHCVHIINIQYNSDSDNIFDDDGYVRPTQMYPQNSVIPQQPPKLKYCNNSDSRFITKITLCITGLFASLNI